MAFLELLWVSHNNTPRVEWMRAHGKCFSTFVSNNYPQSCAQYP
jgi:hypothetical protein